MSRFLYAILDTEKNTLFRIEHKLSDVKKELAAYEKLNPGRYSLISLNKDALDAIKTSHGHEAVIENTPAERKRFPNWGESRFANRKGFKTLKNEKLITQTIRRDFWFLNGKGHQIYDFLAEESGLTRQLPPDYHPPQLLSD